MVRCREAVLCEISIILSTFVEPLIALLHRTFRKSPVEPYPFFGLIFFILLAYNLLIGRLMAVQNGST